MWLWFLLLLQWLLRMGESRSYRISDPAVIAAKVKAAGGPPIDLTQSSGRATANGVTLGWTMGPERIQITILSKPWIVQNGVIWSHIEDALGRPLDREDGA